MPHNTKAQLYSHIQAMRASYGITPGSYPINPIAYASARANIQVLPFSSRALCGIAKAGPVQDSIALNASRTETERRFDCGHEMVHLFLHRGLQSGQFNCYTRSAANQNPILEWEANAGSAELLVPYRLFLPLVRENIADCQTPAGYRRFRRYLAAYFQTTLPVISLRFENLKIELHQYLGGMPLEDIQILSNREQARQGTPIPSFNTLHSVDACGISRPLPAKNSINPHFSR